MLYAPTKAEALDLDSKNQFQLLMKYFNLKRLKGVRKVMETGHGYHLYPESGLTIGEARVMGDCKGRVRYWEKQGFTFTFQAKLGVYTEEEVNMMSEPFWIARGKR